MKLYVYVMALRNKFTTDNLVKGTYCYTTPYEML